MINERYLIKKKLGEGRSKVYLCEDLDLPGQAIAVKILPTDAGSEELKVFRDEFFTLRKLDHPFIIKANEIGIVTKTDENDSDIFTGSSFIAMEYSAGEELSEYPRLSDESVLKEITRQIAAVLYYLHQSNFIYYDLKPENILVSEINGAPKIKLIDLGFCQYMVDNEELVIRGSAEYIAPEILRKEDHDYRVDFYSLGIMLYKIVYGRFPFDTGDELEIYKAHLEKDFNFPDANFSPEFINFIKNLVQKDPSERFKTALNVINALGFEIDKSLSRNWVPAKVFADRLDILNIVKTYIADETSSEVFAIKGFEGSGKSSLLDEIHNRFDDTVLIRNNKSRSGAEFLMFVIKQIVFSGGVFRKLSETTVQSVHSFFSSEPTEYINELKSLFTIISSESDFILLLDGFNSYDDFSIEVFKNIIPILQVEKTKVILSETSDFNYKSGFIFNLREIDLKPFTESNLTEYLNKTFYGPFPKDDLKKLILMYADLLPGNVESFIKDILLLDIVKFGPSGIDIAKSGDVGETLKKSHEEIYALRLQSLSEEEFETARFISSFDITIDHSVISKFYGKELERTLDLLVNLQYKNILQQFNRSSEILFTSDGLKNYIYSTIKNKTEHHLKIAEALSTKLKDFNRIELARQYDLANKFKESYEILKLELAAAEKLSAFSYQERLLQHLKTFPLDEKDKFDIKYQLCHVYYKVSNFRSTIDLANELLEKKTDPYTDNSLLILKGSSFIGLGEYDFAIDLLNSLLPSIENKKKKNELLLDMANAEFYLNRFNSASDKCSAIIESKHSDAPDKARAYTIIGMLDLYRLNDIDTALNHFQQAEKLYQDADVKFRLAQMQMNIGNVYNMKGEYSRAELYWNKSLSINLSIGNLDQEAMLFMNYGIYYYEQLNFDKAVEYYQKAFQIFSTLGKKSGNGLVNSNLGEIYLLICEYEKALQALNESINIFASIQNSKEELEAQFLLAKLHLTLGDYEKFNRSLGIFKIYVDESIEPDNYTNLYAYLVQIGNAAWDPEEVAVDELTQIRKNFLNLEDKFHYFKTTIEITKTYLYRGMVHEAFDELSEEYFSELCILNHLFNAERNYMMGKISEIEPSITIKPAIEYYLTSFNILKEASITEITWQVMFEIGSIYFKGGILRRQRSS